MSEILARWNGLSMDAAEAEILACNGARAWAAGVVAGRPYESEKAVIASSDAVWRGLAEADWMEAFATHPAIGDRIGERHVAAASAASLAWSAKEQSAAEVGAGDEVQRLAAGNRSYEAKFGRTFLICATGKTKAEILAELERRMARTEAEEMTEAAEQQRQITQLRLRRWLKGE